jgi:endonuclease-3
VKRSLETFLATLETHHGKPRAPLRTKDPLDLLYWENVAYLVTDVRRRAAYDALVREVGKDPDLVLKTPVAQLAKIIEEGGMLPLLRARKVRKVAELAKSMGGGGDLRGIAKLPVARAKRALMRFPGIGEPGAAKILAMIGAHPLVAFDSNGTRVLLRLGFGAEHADYTKMYRSVLAAVEKPLAGKTAAELTRAHLLLRTHGQELCTRQDPRCHECPIGADCPSFPV